MAERCAWCGAEVAEDEGWRVAEPAGERIAAFCRLEHVVPWAMQGAHWEPGTLSPAPTGEDLGRCARCGKGVDDAPVIAVRHRGEQRIADALCSVEHLLEWSRAGGRWA